MRKALPEAERMGRGSRAQIGAIFGAAVLLLCCAQTGWASPDRLDNAIPDAAPDTPGAVAFSLGQEWLKLDGTLNNENTTHSLFKLRYQFNPKVSGSIGFAHHNLAGGLGIINPIFDNQDKADSWNFDIGMNLLHTKSEAADEANKKPFTPGSDFTVGVSGEFDNGSAGAVGESTTLLKAYLMYSTDLTNEMRAHTYFSSGRITGGGRSGSVNTVGAGLDYQLATGEHPLMLMADGALDIYNFRDPTFNTSRVSRFDLGLRYKVSRGLYANAGWMTANDSENNASGSGIFAGLNWVQGDDDTTCTVCPPGAPKKDDKGAAPAAAPAKADAGNGPLSADASGQTAGPAGTSPEPSMMDTPSLKYQDTKVEAGLRGTDGLLAANNNSTMDTPSSRSTAPEREEPPLPLFDDSANHKPLEPSSNDKVAASAAPVQATPAPRQNPDPQRVAPLVTPQPSKDHGQVVDLKSDGGESAKSASSAPAPEPVVITPDAPPTSATPAPAQPAADSTDSAPTPQEQRQSELEQRLAAADQEVQAALDNSAKARNGSPADQTESTSPTPDSSTAAPAPTTVQADSDKPESDKPQADKPQADKLEASAAAPEGDKYTPKSRFDWPSDAERAKSKNASSASSKPAKAETKSATTSDVKPDVSLVPAAGDSDRPKPVDAPEVRPKAPSAVQPPATPAATETPSIELVKPVAKPVAKPADKTDKSKADKTKADKASAAKTKAADTAKSAKPSKAAKSAKPSEPGAALLPIDNAPASGLGAPGSADGAAGPAPKLDPTPAPAPASAGPMVEASATPPISSDPHSTEIPLPYSVTHPDAPADSDPALNAAAPSTPAASSAPAADDKPGQPRHIQGTDVMQRPPVTAAAREGLAKLVSLLHSDSTLADHADAGDNAGAKTDLQANASQAAAAPSSH